MKYSKKSHACEEGGAHIRIYFLHLLMKLKNNYLLRKLLKWANKKCKSFKINKVVFFLKNKENVLHLCTKNLDDIIYNSWDIGHDRLKLVILGHFLPFYHLKTWKSRILKKWKICCRCHHFSHVYQKPQLYGQDDHGGWKNWKSYKNGDFEELGRKSWKTSTLFGVESWKTGVSIMFN